MTYLVLDSQLRTETDETVIANLRIHTIKI